MNEMVKNWIARCEKNGVRFAMIQTIAAIYDRVAVIPVSPSTFAIEYPKGSARKGYAIKRDRIQKDDIDKMVYYRD